MLRNLDQSLRNIRRESNRLDLEVAEDQQEGNAASRRVADEFRGELAEDSKQVA
jgi:hypothetical protein